MLPVEIATLLIFIPNVRFASSFSKKSTVRINAGININLNAVAIFLLFFALAAPLGLNTVVFPEAYGGDPSTGASMAMISHTLCVITVPLMYALMILLLGAPPIFI